MTDKDINALIEEASKRLRECGKEEFSEEEEKEYDAACGYFIDD